MSAINLLSFTKQDHPVMKSILRLWSPQTLSRIDEERMIATQGREAYEAANWTTAVTDGRIALFLKRQRHADSIEPPCGFSIPAEWFWSISQIEKGEDVESAKPADIARVPNDLWLRLSVLPELAYWTIQKLNFWSHGRGKPKRKTRPAPEGVVFFTFAGGAGVVVAAQEEAKP